MSEVEKDRRILMAKLLLTLPPEDAEKLPQVIKTLNQTPKEQLSGALDGGGGLPRILEARNQAWTHGGMPAEEAGKIIDTNIRDTPLRDAFSRLHGQNPLILTTPKTATQIIRDFNQNFAQVLRQDTVVDFLGALDHIGSQNERPKLIRSILGSKELSAALRTAQERRPLLQECLDTFRHDGGGINTTNLEQTLKEVVDRVEGYVRYERTLPRGCDERLSWAYYHIVGKDESSDAMMQGRHKELAILNTRHPQHLSEVLDLNRTGRGNAAEILLGASSLSGTQIRGLSSVLLMEDQALQQFISDSSLGEWKSLFGNNPKRVDTLLGKIKSGDFAFADAILASSYLRSGAENVDAYLDSSILSDEKQQGLAAICANIRGTKPATEDIIKSLDELSGMSFASAKVDATPPATSESKIVDKTTEQKPFEITDSAVFDGIIGVEGLIRPSFGQYGEAAVEMMLELGERNQRFRQFITSPTAPKIIEERILPALDAIRGASGQFTDKPSDSQSQANLELSWLRRVLSRPDISDTLTDKGRIVRAANLAATMSTSLRSQQDDLGADIDITPHSLLRTILLSREDRFQGTYTALTDQGAVSWMSSALSAEMVGKVEAAHVDSRLYLRAIAKSPQLAQLIASDEGLRGLEMLNGWRQSDGKPLGLADEYLFQLSLGGEKPTRLGRMPIIDLLNSWGSEDLYLKMGEISPRALIHPDLTIDPTRTSQIIDELQKTRDPLKHMSAERFAELAFRGDAEASEKYVEASRSSDPTTQELSREMLWMIRGNVFVNPRGIVGGIDIPHEFRSHHHDVNAQAISDLKMPYVLEELSKAIGNSKDNSISAQELLSVCQRHPALSVIYREGGVVALDEDLRALRNRGVILNTQNPTISEQYMLTSSLPFEREESLDWPTPEREAG